MSLGTVSELWRYPISSVGGERIDEAHLGADGVVGDRRYALIDAVTGLAASPERELRWRPALQLTSTSLDGLYPAIQFPDGNGIVISDPKIGTRLSEYFGFDVTVGGYAAPENFRLARPRYRHAPIHLLTTASLKHLASLHKSAPIDSRRFRPTFLVETEGCEGFAEDRWVGARLRLGEVVLVGKEQTKRCGVTFASQPGLSEEPDILRSIVRFNRRNFGIYAAVARAGRVRLGDELTLEG